MFKTAAFSTFLAIALSGCLVLPHRAQLQPYVTGQILENGQPVVGAKVFVLSNLRQNACVESDSEAITDLNGRFSIAEVRETRFITAFGDPGEVWGICIQYDGNFIVGWRAGGIGTSPQSATVKCDISQSEQAGWDGSGVCKVVRD